MRTRFVAALTALLVTIGLAAPAGAITNGKPDNGAHPYVGLVVFYNSSGTPLWRCTGTMISATTLLTAGHCTYGTASAQVWFNEHVTTDLGYPNTGGFTGKPHTYTYKGALTLPDTGDVGVVVLNSAPGVGTASIASVGTLDSMATQRGQQNVKFDVVGYGLQEIKPVQMANRDRLRATTQLVNLTSALTDGFNIQQTAAPGTGGGTCFGDSGGPIFLQGTTTIVAVNSFVLNENCAGAGFGYRVDVSGAHNFISQYL